MNVRNTTGNKGLHYVIKFRSIPQRSCFDVKFLILTADYVSQMPEWPASTVLQHTRNQLVDPSYALPLPLLAPPLNLLAQALLLMLRHFHNLLDASEALSFVWSVGGDVCELVEDGEELVWEPLYLC